MVQKIELKGKVVFQCGVCGLKYNERKTAQACEKYCKQHPNSCNPKIAEKAIKD